MRAKVSLIVHATEDEQRILAAMSGVLGIQGEELRLQRLQGHFGNPILYYTAELRGRSALCFAERVLRALPAEALTELAGRCRRHDDELQLSLRISKEALLFGEVKLSQENVVNIVIEGRRQEFDRALPGFSERLGGPGRI